MQTLKTGIIKMSVLKSSIGLHNNDYMKLWL